MGDGVNIAARLEGVANARRDLSLRGRLSTGQRAARHGGRRSRPTQLKNIAETDAGLFAASRRPAKRKPATNGEAAKAETPLGALAADRRDRGARLDRGRRTVCPGRKPHRPLRWTAITPTPAEAAHLSLVALPFANLSGDPAQDYFADGITENLTTDLARIRDSFVIARNTAFTFKGKAIDAKESVRNSACVTCSKAPCSATRTGCASTRN